MLFSMSFLTYSQEQVQDSTRHQAKITEIKNGKKVIFSPELTPLRQIAGAPKAYWKSYWEFGDGHYSFEDKPTHTYKENGEYTVRLSATNNYDDGKPPTTRPKNIRVSGNNDMAFAEEKYHLIDTYNGFRIQNNRDPSPNEEMQIIVSYANNQKQVTQGKLYVFFNEKKFKANNFDLIDVRTYHNEEESLENIITKAKSYHENNVIQTTGINTIIDNASSLIDTTRTDLNKSLEEAKSYYRDRRAWNVNEVKPGEERNLFLTLKTTPEMLKDTSAIITIRSIYVPERGKTKHKITEKEMEIVTSHDPNKMAVYNSFLNYRLVRFKRLKYKIRFQNNGEGPAKLIKLNTDMPKMLDKTTLKVVDMYPKVPICPDNKEVRYSCLDTVFYNNKISFQFKNIYLPGSNQKGVFEKDSTKGFVKYSMKFGKNFHKQKSTSQTEIIFDKNEPIITNRSTSRFKPGISIGAKAGYNYFFTSNEQLDFNQTQSSTGFDTNAKGFFLGATISPYKSYKWYVQAEVMAAVQLIESTSVLREEINGVGAPMIQITNQKNETQKEYLDIVPVSVRYNVSGFLGLGFGPQASLNFWQKSRRQYDSKTYYYINGIQEEEIQNLARNSNITAYNKSIELNNYGVFFDVTLGASRIGPSVGFRYVQNFNKPTSQLQTYAIWKF